MGALQLERTPVDSAGVAAMRDIKSPPGGQARTSVQGYEATRSGSNRSYSFFTTK